MIILSVIRSLFNLIAGRLTFPGEYRGRTVKMEDGSEFRIFRHMHLESGHASPGESILIVRFKFRRFDHRTNIRLSRIPVLPIAGYPGFRDKLWMIDQESGFWQGIYQWENPDALERYKKSFILHVMNKRADAASISYRTVQNKNFEEFIREVMSGG
ncbi:YdhR family protein [bacterium]|nr:YdhR family protein [bacterium]